MSYLEERRMRKEKMAPKLSFKKEKKPIAKKSAKKILEEKEQKELGTDGVLDRWFEERRKEMTGKCCLCGGKSEKHNDETYRRSCHHLLEKRKGMFPSLATHPVNFLEVCFYGNSCHQNIHGGKITWELLFDSSEWSIIRPKLEILLPLCTKEEKKNKLYPKLEKMVYGILDAN